MKYAHRYNMVEMKILCESKLIPSKSNWLDLLRASDLLHSIHLRTMAVSFLRDNFSVLLLKEDGDEVDVGNRDQTDLNDSDLSLLSQEFPGLLEEILAMRKDSFPLPPSQILIKQIKQESIERQKVEEIGSFPYWALFAGMVALFIYRFAPTVISIGPIVPIFNGLFFAGLILYFLIFVAMK
jgi:hypothetical protein